MFYNVRKKSKHLLIMESLFYRMELLLDEEKYYYFSLKKGDNQEEMFVQMLDGKTEDCLVFCDLNLKSGQRYFQIDFLLVQDDTAFVYEIKGLSGEYLYGTDYFKTNKDYQPDNPINQLTKHKNRLREIFKKHDINLKINGFVVFINPEFVLYNIPVIPTFVLPGQVQRHVDDIQKTKYCQTKNKERLIQVLQLECLAEYPYSELPNYSFESLKKGIYCKNCFSFEQVYSPGKVTCKKCGTEEKTIQVINRAVAEYRLLFPAEKITTQGICDWCDKEISSKTIYRYLKRQYEMKGAYRSAHFV